MWTGPDTDIWGSKRFSFTVKENSRLNGWQPNCHFHKQLHTNRRKRASPLVRDQVKPLIYLCYTCGADGPQSRWGKAALRSLLCYIMISSCHHLLQKSFYMEMFPVCCPQINTQTPLRPKFWIECMLHSWTGEMLEGPCCQSCYEGKCITSYGCLWFTHLHKLPAPDISLLGVYALFMSVNSDE